MMDRRFLLAIVLMVAVMVGPSFFMKRPPANRPVPSDTTSARTGDTTAPVTAQTSPGRTTPAVPTATAAAVPARAASAGDTVSVGGRDATFRFSTRGAVLEQATFPRLRDFAHGHKGPVALLRPDGAMLVQRLVVGADTIHVDTLPFGLERRGEALVLTAPMGVLAETLLVSMVADNPFLLDVQGTVGGLEGRGALLILGLGDGFANTEADSQDNYRNYGVASRRTTPVVTDFRSVDTGVVKTVDGPLDWVGVKSKYFMSAVLSADSAHPQFGGAVLAGSPREGRIATRMATWVTMPVGADGRFHFRLYTGPQSQKTVGPLGRDLDRASTYGWIFKPIVMPVAGLVTRVFLWMHENLRMSFGLVLVVFGVMVRLVLWPLNQRAMKSQVAMMAVQPILKDLQERYKNDPQKLQGEMMKVYKEHHVNPLGGCLPLLLPMPVLLALFFVFNRAIELRGTPFLWLPDLAQRDPFYITPLVMGASMFLLSKMSQAGMPPNPQAKTMTYIMPLMMTGLFMNFASGLNLYYAVSNLVSLPQQYLINRARLAEMTRRQVARPAS